jgi:hypothetical protein
MDKLIKKSHFAKLYSDQEEIYCHSIVMLIALDIYFSWVVSVTDSLGQGVTQNSPHEHRFCLY